MSIIDRRQSGGGKSAPNRKKFIDRYKRQIKDSIEKVVSKKSIKDTDQGVDVSIDKNSTEEPQYQYDSSTGKRTYVGSGNDQYSKGDTSQKEQSGEGNGRKAGKGDGEDDFTFHLTKEEFFDLYFEDMALPDFVKESMVGSNKFELKRAGYTRSGSPSKLNAKKTIELAIARRIAAKAQGKEHPIYIDDSDIRYNNIVKKPYPVTRAVVFLIMDVSGSMEEFDKMIAKKFFVLLYLFLSKSYDNVEVRFIRHTESAQEVDEETFFYDRHSGGTLVSEAFRLMNDIMNEEINLTNTNVYVAQASDGDNDYTDNKDLIELLTDSILPKVQYMAYIQTREPASRSGFYAKLSPDVFSTYKKITNKKLNSRVVHREEDVYPVLRELFERGKK